MVRESGLLEEMEVEAKYVVSRVRFLYIVIEKLMLMLMLMLMIQAQGKVYVAETSKTQI